MNAPLFPPAARVAAAKELLDRGWGKSPQFSTADTDEFTRAIDMTDEQLKTRIEATRRLLGLADKSEDPKELH